MSQLSAHGEPWPYPIAATNYIYVEPATVTSNMQICPKCGQWVFNSNLPHACPQITFTSTQNTPHKCPCCDGWGERNAVRPIDNVSERMQPCKACNGSGIIWA